MTATVDKSPSGDDYGPVISQSVAGIFAVFGLAASLGLGWMLARSTSGQPPFQIPRGATTSGTQAQAQTLHVVASDLKFDQTKLSVAGPGQVKIEMENKGAIDHDFTIQGKGFTLPVRPGKSGDKVVSLDKPGTYTFYCSIPGHREVGMQGTITVGDGKAGAATQGSPSSQASPASAAGMADMPGMISHATTMQAEQKGLQEMTPTIQGDYKVFNLTAGVVQWEVLPEVKDEKTGKVTSPAVKDEAWVYNGQMPGPVIHVKEGDKVKVNFKNDLPEPSVIHFHGPTLPNQMDGVADVTQPPVKPGDSFTYEFVAQPAGTYVYHTHHNTATQEPKGLYGVLIIDPKPGSAEAIRDAQYQRDYIQVVSEFGGYFMVNGHSFPATDVLEAKVGEKVRIRLINLGQTIHPMHLHGYHFKVVGTDGYPVKGEPLEKDTIPIAPGERYDLEFEADNPGTWVFHCHILSHVTNQGVEPGGMITVLKVTA